MPEANYYKQFNRENNLKLTAMLDELPIFAGIIFVVFHPVQALLHVLIMLMI